jgi:ribosomal-protein-alanine N-acetyltransferase
MSEETFAQIRKFRKEDIDEILDIEQQAFPKTPYSKKTLLYYAHRMPDSFIVLESGEDIVGYIIFDADGHVHSTAVKPVCRRRGFGKMLFLHVLSSVESRVWLDVRSKNLGAIEFYKRMGMRIIGRVPKYYENDDALVMVLHRRN